MFSSYRSTGRGPVYIAAREPSRGRNSPRAADNARALSGFGEVQESNVTGVVLGMLLGVAFVIGIAAVSLTGRDWR